MSRLMRAGEIGKRPVVTLGGEDVAQVKDIVYSADGGAVGGFTLAGRGLLAGPLKQALPWSGVSALGADAVMVAGEDAFTPLEDVLHGSRGRGNGGAGNVIGSQVLTDEGVDLGRVVDAILDVGDGQGGSCDVVGYEVEASEALGTKGVRLLIPLPDTLAASAEHLVVPASAKDFVREDLAGFGAAVEEFRAQLRGGQA